MNKTTDTVKKFLSQRDCSPRRLGGRPALNGLQGNGGVAFNPFRLSRGTYVEGEKGRWASG